MLQLRRLAAGFSRRRNWFVPSVVHVKFVVDKVALGQVFLRALLFPLSLSLHRCSIFTHVSSGGWAMGPLADQFRGDTVSPHNNNKTKTDTKKNLLSLQATVLLTSLLLIHSSSFITSSSFPFTLFFFVSVSYVTSLASNETFINQKNYICTITTDNLNKYKELRKI
jgi:hypothetical protein